MSKQEIQESITRLKNNGLNIEKSLKIFNLEGYDILDLPPINWDKISDLMRDWEKYFNEEEIDLVDDLIHEIKTSYYYKLLFFCKYVHQEGGFALDAKSRSIIPPYFEISSLNLEGMGLNTISELYNSEGYTALNSGVIIPQIVSFKLLASCREHLLERVGDQIWREQSKISKDCINVTNLIKRRLQDYFCKCPWVVYSDSDNTWKSWRD